MKEYSVFSYEESEPMTNLFGYVLANCLKNSQYKAFYVRNSAGFKSSFYSYDQAITKLNNEYCCLFFVPRFLPKEVCILQFFIKEPILNAYVQSEVLRKRLKWLEKVSGSKGLSFNYESYPVFGARGSNFIIQHRSFGFQLLATNSQSVTKFQNKNVTWAIKYKSKLFISQFNNRILYCVCQLDHHNTQSIKIKHFASENYRDTSGTKYHEYLSTSVWLPLNKFFQNGLFKGPIWSVDPVHERMEKEQDIITQLGNKTPLKLNTSDPDVKSKEDNLD